jgi:hypothetical protein
MSNFGGKLGSAHKEHMWRIAGKSGKREEPLSKAEIERALTGEISSHTHAGGDGLPAQEGHNGKYLTTDGSDASWAALAGGGDMAAATYDPTSVSGDAFSMDNMNDGSTNKVMTATQETNFETAYSHSQAAHGDADADNTASNETSHADVVQDGDFSSNGLMRRTGAGAYDTITDGSTNWDTAYSHSQAAHGDADADNTASNETSHADVVVDGDFSSDGFLIRSGGSGSYSVDTSTYSESDHNHDADYADIANEHAESHTVASHSDTSATGAELDELTDGSTTSLHSHAGGASVYELVKCKGNLSSASFDDTENALSWNSPVIGSGSSNVSISGSEITIDASGTYKFTVTLRTDSANRTELFIRTYINTGAGLTQDTDEIVSDYVSRDADQDTGAVTLITALELDATDVVEFRGFGDTDGACVGLDAGTILLVERVV